MAHDEITRREPSESLTHGVSTSLPELAEIANRHHSGAEAALRTWLSHAIAVGEALLVAQTLVEPGMWLKWVEDNLQFRRIAASRYMRAAYYKDFLMAAGVETGEQFREVAKGLPLRLPVADDRVRRRLAELVRPLRAQGLSYAAIGRQLGVTPEQARLAVDPQYVRQRAARAREANTRKRLEKLAYERQQRDAMVKAAGGSVSAAYALIRRALLELDRCLGNLERPAMRQGINVAIDHCHKAEDSIVRALRQERIA